MKMYAVIPDSQRLDIGKNEVIAMFVYEEHAKKYGAAMWEKFFLIKEVYIEIV